MPTAQLINSGRSIDYTPAADVAAGDVVVQGELVGVAHLDIPAGTKGSINCSGIYRMPKTKGVLFRSVDTGERMYWSPSNNNLILLTWGGPGDEIYAGKTVESAASNDGSVLLRLDQ